jgi:tetrahydromethanopterin S-methyltransferase subunit B
MAINKETDEEKLFTGILRLNAKVFGLILGVIMGLAIFIATNWLLIKGGHINAKGEYVVGPHLQLLSQFFIGYTVSFFGSIIGFFYGFAVGTSCGAMIGWIYNKIVDLRHLS